jgi:hypothetical protein
MKAAVALVLACTLIGFSGGVAAGWYWHALERASDLARWHYFADYSLPQAPYLFGILGALLGCILGTCAAKRLRDRVTQQCDRDVSLL